MHLNHIRTHTFQYLAYQKYKNVITIGAKFIECLLFTKYSYKTLRYTNNSFNSHLKSHNDYYWDQKTFSVKARQQIFWTSWAMWYLFQLLSFTVLVQKQPQTIYKISLCLNKTLFIKTRGNPDLTCRSLFANPCSMIWVLSLSPFYR